MYVIAVRLSCPLVTEVVPSVWGRDPPDTNYGFEDEVSFDFMLLVDPQNVTSYIDQTLVYALSFTRGAVS